MFSLKRSLPVYAAEAFRRKLSAACAAHAGLSPASLILYDVSTLYFETDAGDGLRESGFSKERRLDPQITIGLLTDRDGFPLMVSAFEENKAETKTMLPSGRSWLPTACPTSPSSRMPGWCPRPASTRSRPPGCHSSWAPGSRTSRMPSPGGDASIPARTFPTADLRPALAGHQRAERSQPPGQDHLLPVPRRPRPPHPAGVDEQVAKAEKAAAGLVPVKRNRFITLADGQHAVNRELETKARALAGLKGYTTNLAACPDGTPVTAEFVIGAYYQLFQIEKSFRMAKSELQARPVYYHLGDSIEAHLTVVFAALAVIRWIEARTGWSIRKFVRTARRHKTIQIQAEAHLITAADPLPADLHEALSRIHRDHGAH